MFQHHQVHYNSQQAKVHATNFNDTYILDNLGPYTEYSVYVIAVKLAGSNKGKVEGLKSRAITRRTLAGGTAFLINKNIC